VYRAWLILEAAGTNCVREFHYFIYDRPLDEFLSMRVGCHGVQNMVRAL
jgi:hypothetical protein